MASYEEAKPTVVGIHGAGQGAWHFDLLKPELEAAGYKFSAVDLPIEDPDLNFEDYADVVDDSLESGETHVLVAHSRGGNVAPRLVRRYPPGRDDNRLRLDRIIYVAASFKQSTIGRPWDTEEKDKNYPQKNFADYDDTMETVKGADNMMRYNKKVLPLFFNEECDPGIVEWAFKNFRKQRRRCEDPVMQMWPYPSEIPQDYIVCTKDRVINPEWQRYVAEEWLQIHPYVEIESGHMPALTQPKKLANLIIDLINRPNVQADDEYLGLI